MRKMWWLYILGFLVLAAGVAMSFGLRGMKETLGAQIRNIDLSGVADGTYQGKYEAGRFKNEVEVTVRDHKIVSVTPLGMGSRAIDQSVLKNNYNPMIGKIVEAQSPSVDVITGATATCKSFLKAVENTLIGAGGKVVGL